MPHRVAIVGARRHRQGIGQHVARWLHHHGAEVVAIAGTRVETVDEAQRQLDELYGITCQGFTSVDGMLRESQVDAVAICSPAQFHRSHLNSAAEHGVHTLCEKPLVFEPQRDAVTDAAQVIARFATAGRALMINEQWPYTLPVFSRLYPRSGTDSAVPRRISVTLSPDTTGAEMIPNSLPHAISLLLATAPSGGELTDLNITCRSRDEDDQADSVLVTFCYRHRQGTTEVAVNLDRTPQQPRPAGYAIDGCAVRRVVQLPDYQMWLETGSARQWRIDGSARSESASSEPAPRRVPLPDPLALLTKDFLARCEMEPSARPIQPILLDSVRLLWAIYREALERL